MPAEKGELDDDPRARFLLKGVGDAVKRLRSETVDIEAVCNVADAKDGAILQQLDDSIIQHGHSHIVPRRRRLARACLDIGPRLGGRPNTTRRAL